MPTFQELLKAILAPVLVASLIAGIGRWRKWAWTMPLAVGVAFLIGYALLGVPKLPPRDGNDWLFWLVIPVTLLGVADATGSGRWTWICGGAAGAVAYIILRPLVPNPVSYSGAVQTSLALFAFGAGLVLALTFAERSIGAGTVAAGLCIATGAAGIVVLSSNLRVVGIVGIAAAAALAPVALLAGSLKAGRSLSIVAVPILSGILISGHFYADPGLSVVHFIVLFASPLLLLVGLIVPGKKRAPRIVIALMAVAVAVAAIAVPTAIAAKKAAEGDSAAFYK